MNRRLVPLITFILLTLTSTAVAQDHFFGGSVRGYQFFSIEEPVITDRRDAEVWLARLTQESSFSHWLNFEAHGLFTFTSPPVTGASRIAVTNSWKFLPLDWELDDCENADLLLNFDRLNVQLDFNSTRITIGRQAVTWGVSYFWPALDLFAPFAPQQVDRDYKAGVDAVRVTIALGSFSELELLGGVLGPSASDDGAAAALLRWNLGSVDLGFMGGTFHGDAVAGGFVTSNVKGTGIRGELAFTDSGDPADTLRDRETFWRGSVGLDRQVTPSTTLTVEVAYNGYGASDAVQYLELIGADRVLRGEVTGLGKGYLGVSVTQLVHPLLTLSNAGLVNFSDASLLWIPTLSWSTSDNSEVVAGGQIGFGGELSEIGAPESEFGLVPASIFGAFRVYF